MDTGTLHFTIKVAGLKIKVQSEISFNPESLEFPLVGHDHSDSDITIRIVQNRNRLNPKFAFRKLLISWDRNGNTGFIIDQYKSEHTLLLRSAMRILLAELLIHHGILSIHASCVGLRNGKSVLVAGHKDSGKTTIFLELVKRGYIPIAEDICFLYSKRGNTFVEGIEESNSLKRPSKYKRTAELLPWITPLKSKNTKQNSFETSRISGLRTNNIKPSALVLITDNNGLNPLQNLLTSTNLLIGTNIISSNLKLQLLNKFLTSIRVIEFKKCYGTRSEFTRRISKLVRSFPI